MRKVEATILLVLLLVFGGIVYLEFCVPKQTQVVHGPAIRIVDKEFDTLRIIKSKYKTLHDTQTIIQTKYETLFVAYRGDTSCNATRRIIAMHRFLDSCGK
jgi:archaellum component FlaF (FlaF/FlaG flagellin family)